MLYGQFLSVANETKEVGSIKSNMEWNAYRKTWNEAREIKPEKLLKDKKAENFHV